MNALRICLLVCTMIVFVSCKDDKTKVPDNALDTGRMFIRASLDGDFATAEPLIYQDSTNGQLFQRYKQYFKALPNTDKNSYTAASYEINRYTDVNDSTAIINYSNSYMKKPIEIKVIRIGGKWLIDFKHTSGNQ